MGALSLPSFNQFNPSFDQPASQNVPWWQTISTLGSNVLNTVLNYKLSGQALSKGSISTPQGTIATKDVNLATVNTPGSNSLALGSQIASNVGGFLGSLIPILVIVALLVIGFKLVSGVLKAK